MIAEGTAEITQSCTALSLAGTEGKAMPYRMVPRAAPVPALDTIAPDTTRSASGGGRRASKQSTTAQPAGVEHLAGAELAESAPRIGHSSVPVARQATMGDLEKASAPS